MGRKKLSGTGLPVLESLLTNVSRSDVCRSRSIHLGQPISTTLGATTLRGWLLFLGVSMKKIVLVVACIAGVAFVTLTTAKEGVAKANTSTVNRIAAIDGL